MKDLNSPPDSKRGKRISELIKASGMKKYQIAAAAGVTGSMITKVIQGEGFSLEVLIALSQELHTTTDYILTGHDALEGFNRLNPRQMVAVLNLIKDLN